MSRINLCNRQRAVKFDLRWLRGFADVALPECEKHRFGVDRGVLADLPAIEVAIVSDRAIAAVHQEFMGIAGATDVITFDHGEIVISAETARTSAPAYAHRIEEELGLYLVHGLLHLNGFLDKRPPDAARMRKVQASVLNACLAVVPLP